MQKLSVCNAPQLRTLAECGNDQSMKLVSIMATQHWYDGEVNGNPVALLLVFDYGRLLKLRGAGNGSAMLTGSELLDSPMDMKEYGKTGNMDVSQTLFPTLCGADVSSFESLMLDAQQVGVRLVIEEGEAYYFWNEDDELGWGDEATFSDHPWLDDDRPKIGEEFVI